MIKAKDRIRFLRNTYKVISNWELDISGYTGVVIEMGPLLRVRLDHHVASLDEWQNEVQWGIDEYTDELPDSPNDFWSGFLASIAERIERPAPQNLHELEAHLQWLADTGFAYHLDDNPAEIEWFGPKRPTEEELARIVEMDAKIWEEFTSDQIWDAAGRLWTREETCESCDGRGRFANCERAECGDCSGTGKAHRFFV